MRRCRVAVTVVVGVCLSLLASGCAGGGGAGGGGAVGGGAGAASWTVARQLPVRQVVAGYSSPTLTSLWCGSPGNCVLSGSRERFTAPAAREAIQVFALSQANGAWDPPQVIAGQGAPIVRLSCSGAGRCVAAGNAVTVDSFRALVATQERGGWSKMSPPPGLTALAGRGGGTAIDAVSCGAAGMCVVVGHYWPAGVPQWQAPRFRPFAVTEHDGTWGSAQPIPGLAALRVQDISAISCDLASTCSLTGIYRGRSGRFRAFVVSDQDGTWGRPQAIAVARGGPGGGGSVGTIACTATGDCSAAGIAGEEDGPRAPLPFVVTQTAGAWDRPTILDGAPAVRVRPDDFGSTIIAGLSCSAPGQCGLAGYTASISTGEHDNVDASAVFVASHPRYLGPGGGGPGADGARRRFRPGHLHRLRAK